MKTLSVLKPLIIILILNSFINTKAECQQSVAREWNEVLLQAIREDYARPTVHSRNLFHTSMAMYDAWAVYDPIATTYFLGNKIGDYQSTFAGIKQPIDIQLAQEEAISYAAYRILIHRFSKSPNAVTTLARFDSLFNTFNYDPSFTSEEYKTGSPAALGNYIAAKVIEYGLQDGANEQNEYANNYYYHVNPPIAPALPGNPSLIYPNRWQPITLDLFIDQSGNAIPGTTQPFLGPEWGNVDPFALSEEDLTIYMRDKNEYMVYHDPTLPPLLEVDGSGLSAEYQWGFSLVSKWSSQLDPSDNVLIDISPASIGNVKSFPTSIEALHDFYNEQDGGDPGVGYSMNPKTGQAYSPQIVPRADYARVLAEFWADGPNSETPPGHWFTVLNYVNDNNEFEKRYKGTGEVLDDLEWDIKAYLALSGAMHDVAVSAWGIKGWYDYIRPVSAIRYMADQGQSSEPNSSNYSPEGIPLSPGLIELVESGDALAGTNNENIGKIKLFSWKGPDYIIDPTIDVAGVGWILADNWWPYQRPSFVTPPFAGYISGHSTFSRAAAEVLTILTGDPYFPGGLGEFKANKNEFLVFEEGPSVDITLQWATYRDASDQCSLSRIWGGIHPPADDIPGRLIGERIGVAAFNLANDYFNGLVTSIGLQEEHFIRNHFIISPNPIKHGENINIKLYTGERNVQISLTNLAGLHVFSENYSQLNNSFSIDSYHLKPGIYIIKLESKSINETQKIVIR